MTLDHSEDPSPDIPGKPPSHGRLIAAGVVGALALGAGMGLWARPAPPPAPGTPMRAPEDAPRPALQIVVDDSPPPVGQLLEVLPGDDASHPSVVPQAPPPPAEPMVPRRPAAGLMKVDAVIAAQPLLVPAVKVERRVEPRPEPEASTVRKAEADKAKLERARLEKARAEKAKAEARAEAEALKVAEARKAADKAKAAEKVKQAKLEKARAEKLAQAEKAEKAKAVKLAEAKAKTEKAAKAKAAETRRLAALAKAQKAEAAKKKTELAQAKAKPAKVQKASTKPAAARPPARKAPEKAPPPPRRPAPVGEGPMRVARNDACASSDPGESAVCADRRLSARDRQLQQAYRNAEAAGVPAAALRRQQARWLQARAAAAREAPWAVEDVYEARISELNDLTRDAREN